MCPDKSPAFPRADEVLRRHNRFLVSWLLTRDSLRGLTRMVQLQDLALYRVHPVLATLPGASSIPP
jgi:hypothetical protein